MNPLRRDKWTARRRSRALSIFWSLPLIFIFFTGAYLGDMKIVGVAALGFVGLAMFFFSNEKKKGGGL